MEKTKKKKPRKITPKYLENSAMYYLERFSSSSENLRQVMKRKIYKSCKFYGDDNISEKEEWLSDLINKFQRIGYLNDESYALSKIRGYRYSGDSKKKIISKLASKGVSADIINNSLTAVDEEMFEEDGEIESARKYIRKRRFGKYRTKEVDDKTLSKELASLARAGFNYDIAKSVLEEE